jgi:hypothetical protein
MANIVRRTGNDSLLIRYPILREGMDGRWNAEKTGERNKDRLIVGTECERGKLRDQAELLRQQNEHLGQARIIR